MVKKMGLKRILYLSVLLIVIFQIYYFYKYSKINIEGKYINTKSSIYGEPLGERYILLLNDKEFKQILFTDSATTEVNSGKYSYNSSEASFTFWKYKDELIHGDGGCAGCKAKIELNTLLFYKDPDGAPCEIFEKVNP